MFFLCEHLNEKRRVKHMSRHRVTQSTCTDYALNLRRIDKLNVWWKVQSKRHLATLRKNMLIASNLVHNKFLSFCIVYCK